MVKPAVNFLKVEVVGYFNEILELMLDNQKGNLSIILGFAVIIILIAGGAYYLGTQNTRIPSSNSNTQPKNLQADKLVNPTNKPVETQDHQIDEKTDWKIHNGQVYSLKYPYDWIVNEAYDDYFGNQITVTNSAKSTVLRVLTGRQPYGYSGSTDVKSNSIVIKVEGVSYDVKEEIVDGRTALVDHTVKKGGKEYQILFGTGYPVGEDKLASIPDYYAAKETLIKILSTLVIK